jgi:uncharacterized phage protein gp47/JayE
MASIDPTGFTPTRLNEYLTRIRENWSIVFGEDLNFDADTPQAEYTAADSLMLTEMDEVLADMAASLDIFQAGGQQLDNLISILAILRKGEIKSNVSATLTGQPLAVIAAGSQAKLDTGELFELIADVTLDGGGSNTGTFEAVESGAINIPAGTLTQIVTPVAGWETVNNSAQGATGELEEKDFTFRRRYFAQLAINAVTPIDSIVAGVFALDLVTDVAGFENDTAAPVVIEGISIPANSIAISVSGGDDDEIAAAIREKKTLGCGTDGDVTVQVPVYLPDGETLIQTLDIEFYRVSDVDITIDLDLTVNADFPDNGEQQIKDDLLAYFNGSDQFTGEFELDGLQIAEDVFKSRLYTPINRTQGHVINTLSLQSTPALESVTIDLNEKAKLVENDITIVFS